MTKKIGRGQADEVAGKGKGKPTTRDVTVHTRGTRPLYLKDRKVRKGKERCSLWIFYTCDLDLDLIALYIYMGMLRRGQEHNVPTLFLLPSPLLSSISFLSNHPQLIPFHFTTQNLHLNLTSLGKTPHQR